MKVAKSIAQLRAWRKRRLGRVVFVPTMGALHAGHAALVRAARKLAGPGGTVVVSIFVNPIQFGPKEDFASYPRPLKNDLAVCRTAGADAVFVPSPQEMYFDDRSVFVDESLLSASLCGQSRPGHFRGVCTVVAKLFLIVQPTHALFGEKDWQQLAVLRRMVRDLNFPVEVAGHPTVRESDGLATSSRNVYLNPSERALASRIHAALLAGAGKKSPTTVESTASRLISAIPGARIDYVEAVHAETLQPLTSRKFPGRLAAAVFLGATRLIDNIPLPPTP
ncbi:MAG: pantoate--beta-alanine ligase [Verrucomicrobiaceae bacterium]|nr:MAG: pantoate--beta-alanine ligase [Verrucomicrobiaceae bacterium]